MQSLACQAATYLLCLCTPARWPYERNVCSGDAATNDLGAYVALMLDNAGETLIESAKAWLVSRVELLSRSFMTGCCQFAIRHIRYVAIHDKYQADACIWPVCAELAIGQLHCDRQHARVPCASLQDKPRPIQRLISKNVSQCVPFLRFI